MRVPDSLRAIVGKREFRQSLKTTDLAEAKQALAIQRLMASAELQDAQRKIATPVIFEGAPERWLTEADLWSLAVTWFVGKQKADAQLRPAAFCEEDRLQELVGEHHLVKKSGLLSFGHWSPSRSTAAPSARDTLLYRSTSR